MEEFNFSTLRQYDFIVLRQGKQVCDGGLVLEIDRPRKIIRYLSPQQENVVDLILEENTGNWHFLKENKKDANISFSLKREAYAPSFFE